MIKIKTNKINFLILLCRRISSSIDDITNKNYKNDITKRSINSRFNANGYEPLISLKFFGKNLSWNIKRYKNGGNGCYIDGNNWLYKHDEYFNDSFCTDYLLVDGIRCKKSFYYEEGVGFVIPNGNINEFSLDSKINFEEISTTREQLLINRLQKERYKDMIGGN